MLKKKSRKTGKKEYCYVKENWHEFKKPTKEDCSIAGRTLARSKNMTKKERQNSTRVKKAARVLEECFLKEIPKIGTVKKIIVSSRKKHKSKNPTILETLRKKFSGL